MRDYISRLNRDSKTYQKIFWWICRTIMIFGILYTAFIQSEESFEALGNSRTRQLLQMSANMLGLFAWDITQACPKKSFMRFIPAYVQNYSAVSFTLASFGGAFLNFYYKIPTYDLWLHLTGGAAGAWIGYEVVTAIQLRDRKNCSLSILLWASAGICFMICTGWELFEFTFDQITGDGDTQHWSLELARESAEIYGTRVYPNIIPHLHEARFALMDTMEDIICNTIGIVAVMVFLRICPYHHKGKNSVEHRIEALLAEDARIENKKIEVKEGVTA